MINNPKYKLVLCLLLLCLFSVCVCLCVRYVASNFQELSPLLADLEGVKTESAAHIVRGLSAASQW